MCRRVTCRTCGRPDWRGCGAHIERVLGDVPPDERCRCRQAPAAERAAAGGRGLLRRLTGR